MAEQTVITIEINGPTQSGKSAILASIRGMLEANNYCVAIPDCEERNNPSRPLGQAEYHEKPKANNTVIILSEAGSRR